MLSSFRKTNPLLLKRFTASFGGHSEPVNIEIDKNANWIRYKAVVIQLFRTESLPVWKESRISMFLRQVSSKSILSVILAMLGFSVRIYSIIMIHGIMILNTSNMHLEFKGTRSMMIQMKPDLIWFTQALVQLWLRCFYSVCTATLTLMQEPLHIYKSSRA